jgi:hypothetical protein
MSMIPRFSEHYLGLGRTFACLCVGGRLSLRHNGGQGVLPLFLPTLRRHVTAALTRTNNR